MFWNDIFFKNTRDTSGKIFKRLFLFFLYWFIPLKLIIFFLNMLLAICKISKSERLVLKAERGSPQLYATEFHILGSFLTVFAVIREKQGNACGQQKCIKFNLWWERNSLLFSPDTLNLQAYFLTNGRLSLSNRSQSRVLRWRSGQLHCVSKNFGDGEVSLSRDKTFQKFLVYSGFNC